MAKHRRLNDTAAITSMPSPAAIGDSESLNVEVRRIDNGYITRESRYSQGDYKSCERFSQDKPVLGDLAKPQTSPGRSSLRNAVRSLK
jgi:hypothetical protein